MATVSVLGAGSWGTALAVLLARNGHRVTLWGHRAEHVAALRAERRNQRYLPGATFPDTLDPITELAEAARAEVQLVAVPSHAFGKLLQDLKPHLPAQARIAWATKGLELGTGRLLHEVAEAVFGPDTPTAVLSGPTFAAEVAASLPTALTVASAWPEFATTLAGLLRNNRFRAYTTDDVIGVQLGVPLRTSWPSPREWPMVSGLAPIPGPP